MLIVVNGKLMSKYLDEEIANKALAFDKDVDGSVQVLKNLGVCAVPSKKEALLIHWLTVYNNITVHFNLNRTIMWLDTLEPGVQKALRK